MRLSRFGGFAPRAWIAGLAILAAVAGCSTDELAGPTPPMADVPAPSMLIAPEVGVEQPGFTFLAPLGTLQFKPPTGVFDRGLLSELTVEICERSNAGCRLPLIKTFKAKAGLTMTDGILGDAYQALWTVTDRTADRGKVYRIRVLRGQTELGYADLKVVSWLEILLDLKSVVGGGKVPLGSIVPIRFHVAKGATPPAGTPVGPDGGTVSLAGGRVSLVVPAGAVAAQTTITAVPATNLPAGGPAVVPGTAWDFGPDGTVFARPVRMTIGYDPANLPPGTVESDLRIHKLVNGVYRQQNAGAVDLVNRTVSADVDGFSIYVVLPRIPGREEDIVPPVVTGVEVFNPASGTWGSAVTLDASAADVIARFRVTAQDNITGVRSILITLQSPLQTIVASCNTSPNLPVSGSDTQGVWECPLSLPQYSHAGDWRLIQVWAGDAVGNTTSYYGDPQSSTALCSLPGLPCLSSVPVVTLVSNPSDVTGPMVSGPIEVGLDTAPGTFGQSVSIDVTAGSRTVIIRFPYTDDLSGIEQLPFVRFQAAAGGGLFLVGQACQRQGTALTGAYQCLVSFPQHMPAGAYYLGALNLQDRVGNRRSYAASPSGPVCEVSGGACLGSAPIVNVVSAADTQAPLLRGLAIAVDELTVTTTIDVTDDTAGFSRTQILYRSATTSQVVNCSAFPSQPSTAATVSCAITFSESAARGSWYLEVVIQDAIGNSRRYTRSVDDGSLCYTDSGQLPECHDFGDTELVLRDTDLIVP